MKLKYEDPKSYSKLEAQKIMQYGTISEQCKMLVGVTYNEPDFWNAYNIVLSYCRSEHIELRELSIICILHLARIHEFIPAYEVAIILQEALLDHQGHIAQNAEDALWDIHIFCPKEFVEIKKIIENNFKISRQSKINFSQEININNGAASKEETAEYKQILIDILNVLPQNFDKNLFEKALYTISMIGTKQIYELTDELYKIMDSVKILRNNVIFVLGFSSHLHLPQFMDKAYDIFLKDSDPDTKFTALQVWISYYYNSQDPGVLKELYKILIDENYNRDIRITALSGIFEVRGFFPSADKKIYIANLMNCRTPKEFNDRVDWEEITKVLKKHAPNALRIYPIKTKK